MIKVGILGTGFGQIHMQIYSQLNNVEIVGVYGRNIEKLAKIKEELKVNVTTNMDDLINHPDIDLIDVCLPTAIHKEIVIQALKNNKHVFCETPVSYILEEAEEMKKYSEKYNKKLFVNLFYKFSDPHKLAIDKIKSNALGKPLIVTAYQKTPPYWGNMNVNKIIQDFMLHNFDFITEIMGMPTEVIANGVEKENSHVFATLKYENGLASIESSTMMPNKFPFSIGFHITCESGTITFNGEFGENTIQRYSIYTKDEAIDIPLPSNDEYVEAIKHVINNIANDERTSFISIDEAIKSLKIALATRDSLRHKRTILIN